MPPRGSKKRTGRSEAQCREADRGPRKGICDGTGNRHVQLCGAQDGKLMTKLAEPYHAPLGRLLARCFSAALCSLNTRRMRHIASSLLAAKETPGAAT